MEHFIGQIEPFAFRFAPQGWLQCNGQLLAIEDYRELFFLIGTTYGGDGTTTFAIPRLAPTTPGGPDYFICALGGEFPRQ